MLRRILGTLCLSFVVVGCSSEQTYTLNQITPQDLNSTTRIDAVNFANRGTVITTTRATVIQEFLKSLKSGVYKKYSPSGNVLMGDGSELKFYKGNSVICQIEIGDSALDINGVPYVDDGDKVKQQLYHIMQQMGLK